MTEAAASAPSQAVSAKGGIVVVERPAPGAIVVVQAEGASRLAMKFGVSDVKIVLLDVDMVLVFPDGAKVILPGFGLAAVSEDAPSVGFLDREVPAEELIQGVEDVKLLDEKLSVRLTTADPVQDDSAGSDNTAAPRPTGTPIQVAANDFVSRAPPVSAGVPLTALNDEIAGNPSSGSPPRPFNPFDDGRIGNITGLDMTVQLFTPTTGSRDDAQKSIVPAFAAPGAESDPGYAAQSATAEVFGTSGNDRMGRSAAVFERIVTVRPDFPVPNITVTELTVSGLPDGYRIVGDTPGVTKLGPGSFKVSPDQSGGPGIFRFVLEYTLPPDGTKLLNGFYDDKPAGYSGRFTAIVTFSGTSPDGPIKATGSFEVGVADVSGQEGLIVKDPATNAPVIVLWANPPGVRMSGGGGDDVLEASGGKDTLDGGGEQGDIVSYERSVSAVAVTLKDGFNPAVVSGGAAAGDVLTRFAGVRGSGFADTLTGNSGRNRLEGLGGRDLLDGGGDNDTLEGGNDDDTLIGGSGDDSIVGGTGADSMEGGEGDDVYSVDDAGDSILEEAGQPGGRDTIASSLTVISLADRKYDNVENLVAVLAGRATFSGAGDEFANIIDARDPSVAAATLFGGAEKDALYGSAGADCLDGGLDADNMVGGRGDDTYIVDDPGDAVQEMAGEGTDEVRTTLRSYTLAAHVERLVALSAAAFLGRANNDADNRLDASLATVATLLGGTKNDVLIGSTGLVGPGASRAELLDVQSSAYNSERNLILNKYEARRATYGILHALGRLIPAAIASGPKG